MLDPTGNHWAKPSNGTGESKFNQVVDFNTYMSIGLDKCGSSRSNFRELVAKWNQNEEQIRNMSESEVREAIVCP